jgi:hypothetical protein
VPATPVAKHPLLPASLKTAIQAGYPLDLYYAAPREALLHEILSEVYAGLAAHEKGGVRLAGHSAP